MIVRSWNLFHGNTAPPGRHQYVREMIELISADEPDIVCLQEVPVWAFPHLEEWSGMQAITVKVRKPTFGPLPITARFGRRLTKTHAGKLRSAFNGQGNAILLRNDIEVADIKNHTLNTNVFCEAQGAKLHLSNKTIRQWEKERRMSQTIHIRRARYRWFYLANTHCTSHNDERLPDAELHRAAVFVDKRAERTDVVMIAGDFNVSPQLSETMRWLNSKDPPYSAPGPSIDHILVRGAPTGELLVWPDERRELNGQLLSDHAPVELKVDFELESEAPAR